MNTTRISLEKVAEFARAHASSEGMVSTCVPGLHLMYIERHGDRVHSTYRPLVCLVLQGAKRITVGHQETVCSQGLSVIVSAGMPVNGQVIEASAASPYLALAMEFDWPSLSEQAELLNVSAEMGLNVLAYNFKRVLSILGFEGMMKAMRLVGA